MWYVHQRNIRVGLLRGWKKNIAELAGNAERVRVGKGMYGFVRMWGEEETQSVPYKVRAILVVVDHLSLKWNHVIAPPSLTIILLFSENY